MRLLTALGATTLIIVACGNETPTTSSETSQRYTASATVLESPEHGPQLCLGFVADSLPPQCGGPDIPNWDWDTVADAETVSGTTWGEYTVVGTYDGTAFTLTEAPQPPTEHEIDNDSARLSTTPCEEPDGGWAVVDEATATDEAMNGATDYANGQADHAGTWLDQSINPALDDLERADIEGLANDPTKLVLNFRFTGDIDRHESELRSIWGGALCISLAEHSEAELLAIQQELHEDYDGVLSSGIGSVAGRLNVRVILDDGSLQAELDDRYGPGLVLVNSALQPVD